MRSAWSAASLWAKIDARLRQGKADDRDLGGMSMVCVGDPAQCEAMRDQQLYDLAAHRDTAAGGNPSTARYSNKGLTIYEGFEDVIVLTTSHRIQTVKDPSNEEERAYNARAKRFLEILHRLRDLEWALEDISGSASGRKRINH